MKIINLASKYKKPIMMHCCGSVYPMIDHFINMGLSILNPIQPSANEMEPERLVDEYGGRIAFHGGVGIQDFLPNALPSQVKEHVHYLEELLGANGGYIMASAHHIQSDTPLENVLAMYGIDKVDN